MFKRKLKRFFLVVTNMHIDNELVILTISILKRFSLSELLIVCVPMLIGFLYTHASVLCYVLVCKKKKFFRNFGSKNGQSIKCIRGQNGDKGKRGGSGREGSK